MNKLVITLLFILFCISSSFAAIRVVSVKGQAAFKTGNQWNQLRSGMGLPVGAKVSTGADSTVVLKIDDHTVTIKPLSMMKIYENSVKKEERNTRIGLRRGSIRARVSREKRIRTTFKVSTPVATSSVRGTEEEISYGPNNGMVVRVIEGNVWGANKNGIRKIVKGRLKFHQKNENPLPEPLIDEVRERAFVYVYDSNITRDEKESSKTRGSERIGTADEAVEFMKASSTSWVNIHLTFPLP